MSDMLPLCYYPYFHPSPSARPAKPAHSRGGLSKLVWVSVETEELKIFHCSRRYKAGAGQSALCRRGERLGGGGRRWRRWRRRGEGRLSV